MGRSQQLGNVIFSAYSKDDKQTLQKLNADLSMKGGSQDRQREVHQRLSHKNATHP